jgi:hypothetical protein
VVQGIECLLCKSEALSSNSSPTKRRKEQRKGGREEGREERREGGRKGGREEEERKRKRKKENECYTIILALLEGGTHSLFIYYIPKALP